MYACNACMPSDVTFSNFRLKDVRYNSDELYPVLLVQSLTCNKFSKSYKHKTAETQLSKHDESLYSLAVS